MMLAVVDTARRLAKIRVEPAALAGLLERGAIWRVARNGIPGDVRVVGVYSDPETHTIQVMLEGEAFDPIPQYGKIPNLPDVELERLDG